MAVRDGCQPRGFGWEPCSRVIVADELWLCTQFVDVVDMMRRGWWRRLQYFHQGFSKSYCFLGLVASIQQRNAPQFLVWALVPLQHCLTGDPYFCVCCVVNFESIAFKYWDVPFLYEAVEAVQIVFIPLTVCPSFALPRTLSGNSTTSFPGAKCPIAIENILLDFSPVL